jgi:AI-2 transport protein TqsA
MNMENRYNEPAIGIIKVASWVLVIVLLTVIMKTMAFLFIPLSISLLFCYALGIPLDFLQRFPIPSFMRTLLVILFIVIVIYLLGRLVSINIREFQGQLPLFEEKFWEYARSILTWLNISPDQVREVYDSFLKSFSGMDFKPVGTLVQRLSGSFFSFLGNMMWVFLFMIFMLAERENFTKRIVKGFGKTRSESVLDALGRINKAVQDYLGLKTLISMLTGVLVTLTLFVLDVPFAVLWGVLTFLLNFIPNIGSLIAVLPPVAIALFESGSFGKMFIVALVLVCIQIVVGNYVEPKMMGRGLNLSPLVVLLSLVFWGWMWGIPGMLLSVPLTAAIKIACEQLDSTRTVAVLMSGK